MSEVKDRLKVATNALRNIAPKRECESFTSGIGSCFRSGRLLRAKYGAEQACASCIAYDALDKIAGKEGLRKRR